MRNEFRFAFGLWLVVMALTALPAVVVYGLSGGTPSALVLTIPIILVSALVYALGPMGLLWPMELTRREKWRGGITAGLAVQISSGLIFFPLIAFEQSIEDATVFFLWAAELLIGGGLMRYPLQWFYDDLEKEEENGSNS